MKEKIKVAIVGAGISGLAAGVYLYRSGFDVTIYEQHNVPGGLSSSWSRKGYLFEGGMHWLTGSSEKLTLNRIWREVGALKENNPIFLKDPFYTLIDNNAEKRELHLYRDIKKLEKHLLEYAPEDEKAIKQMCMDAKLFAGVHMPVGDIPFLKTERSTQPSLIELIKMAPAALRLPVLANQPYVKYVSKFKNKNIRHLLLSVIGYRYNALSFIYTIASFASGDCGFPEGGSRIMTQNMAETFLELGGKIEYNSKVERVATEEIKNGKRKTVGVIVNGELKKADAIAVTQDAMSATESILDCQINESWISKLKKVKTEQNMFICLGVKADLKNYPRAFIIPLEKPFMAGGIEFSELRVNNYALYKNHSPEGCTSLTCLLLGDSYKWWKTAKTNGTYKQKKEELADTFVQMLENHIPEIKDNVEVTDVATPLTYERYCSSHEGSWMSVWGPGDASFSFPCKSKTIYGLYFAGQRMMMPGGLPVAVTSGRKAAQYICRDNGAVFR